MRTALITAAALFNVDLNAKLENRFSLVICPLKVYTYILICHMSFRNFLTFL